MTAKELPAGDWRRVVYGRSQISGIGQRRQPRATDRERIIAQQGYQCLYCEIPISAKIWRRRREVMLVAAWDHFIPYAYSQRNPSNNWVLACHVCNNIKKARMFDDVEAARQAILPERIALGYESPDAVLHRLGVEREQGAVLVTVARPTERQLEVVQLAARGLSARGISNELKIAPGMVQKHIIAAARRMGVQTWSEAIEVAARNGFVELPASETPQPESQVSAREEPVTQQAQPAARTLSVWERLTELSQLQDGWLDGQGKAPSTEVLEAAGRLVTALPRTLGAIRIYPTEAGGVQLEWDDVYGGHEIEIMPDLRLCLLTVEPEPTSALALVEGNRSEH